MVTKSNSMLVSLNVTRKLHTNVQTISNVLLLLMTVTYKNTKKSVTDTCALQVNVPKIQLLVRALLDLKNVLAVSVYKALKLKQCAQRDSSENQL